MKFKKKNHSNEKLIEITDYNVSKVCLFGTFQVGHFGKVGRFGPGRFGCGPFWMWAVLTRSLFVISLVVISIKKMYALYKKKLEKNILCSCYFTCF